MKEGSLCFIDYKEGSKYLFEVLHHDVAAQKISYVRGSCYICGAKMRFDKDFWNPFDNMTGHFVDVIAFDATEDKDLKGLYENLKTV